MNSMGYEAKSTTLKSRRRKRTEKAAVALLDGQIRLPPEERKLALAQIRIARQPVPEARRIITLTKRREVEEPYNNETVDHADVQELRAKLIRRDGGNYDPQRSMLTDMDRVIALSGMGREEFEERSALL